MWELTDYFSELTVSECCAVNTASEMEDPALWPLLLTFLGHCLKVVLSGWFC